MPLFRLGLSIAGSMDVKAADEATAVQIVKQAVAFGGLRLAGKIILRPVITATVVGQRDEHSLRVDNLVVSPKLVQH